MIIGVVQLIRRGEDDVLYAGHWLCGLLIKPLFRGMGIGEALSLKVIEKARQKNVGELKLLVFQDNHAAKCMYAKLDFIQVVILGLEKFIEEEMMLTSRRQVVMRLILH